jgi:hypothetical protein
VDEKTWLSCTDPRPMLEFLGGRAGDRKLRLFAAACCRRIWGRLPSGPDEFNHQAVEVAERFADGLVGPEALDAAAEPCAQFGLRNEPLVWGYDAFQTWPVVSRDAFAAAGWVAAVAAQVVEGDAPGSERAGQCALLRDLFGNPFRRRRVDPAYRAWQGGTVTRLAQAAYDERALPSGLLENARLAVLADALEEAGCADADVLGHLRGPGPHVRGCWVVDLLTEKS